MGDRRDSLLKLAAAMFAAVALTGQAAADEAVQLKIVGGLAGITQFRQYEEPFWTKKITELSGGRLKATIKPFDQSGLRAQDMLQLMQLGVVPFGTAIVTMVAGDDPELNAVDLPALNPSFSDLRATVGAYRPFFESLLSERYDVELLGIYVYPAQVLYCKGAFKGLGDLAGRRIRTSSVSQSEMVTALGAVPVQVPFAQLVPVMTKGVVDCAITGTLSGNEIGLSDVTTHIHALAINWGLSIFGANRQSWQALPADARDVIRRGVRALEAEIWADAERETQRGLACNIGRAQCGDKKGRMTLVPASAADEERRKQLLVETVLPQWIRRCGASCSYSWNQHLAPLTGIQLQPE